MMKLVEKLTMFAVMAGSSVGGLFGYNYFAGETGGMTIDELAAMVDWENLAMVVTKALGNN